MATSGTYTWNLDIDEIIREAVELAGGQQALGNDPVTLMRSLNLLFTDLTNRKINLFTLAQKTLALTAGTATYDLDAEDVDVLNGAIRQGTGTSQSDLHIERIGFDLYAQITPKESPGLPSTFFVQRGVTRPTVTFWPVPNTAVTFYYWVFKRFEDANGMTQNAAVPFRFLPALTNGLAYQLARKRAAQTVDKGESAALENRIARLKLEY
jgi:hypothetical protein